MPIHAAAKPGSHQAHLGDYLEDLQARNYALSTIRTNQQVLSIFLGYLRACRVRDIRSVGEEHVFGFARSLPRQETRFRMPLGTATQAGYLSIVRGFFAWLDTRNLILRNPAAALSLPKVKRLPRGVLSEAQARRLMTAPDPWSPWGIRDRAILETLYGTGIRRRECLRLQLSDLDLAQRLLLIRNGKGRKDRIVPVPARAALALDLYLRDGRPRLLREPRVRELFLSFRGRSLSEATRVVSVLPVRCRRTRCVTRVQRICSRVAQTSGTSRRCSVTATWTPLPSTLAWRSRISTA